MAKLTRFLFVFTCLGTASCASIDSEYVAAPIKGWVIDRDSKQPVEGAVVVAYWQLEGGLYSKRKTILMASEAVTDENGQYEMSGWGPVENPGSDRLCDYDPGLFVLKHGYASRLLSNFPDIGPMCARYDRALKKYVRKSRERVSDWDGKKIEMEKHQPFSKPGYITRSLDEVIESEVSNMEGTLSRLIEPYDEDSRNCVWKNLRRAYIEAHLAKVQAMDNLRSTRQLLSNYGTAIENLQRPNERLLRAGCPSPKEFFKEYLIATCVIASCGDIQPEYVAAPMKGWVVDKDTKHPIEGAVVVAQWLLEGGIHHGGGTTLMASEAVTDKNGYYEIPGWGPIRNPGSGQLFDADPTLHVFKRGFRLTGFRNSQQFDRPPGGRYDLVTGKYQRKGRERFSIWDDKQLEIERLKPLNRRDGCPSTLLEVSASEVSNMELELSKIDQRYGSHSGNCFWKDLPRAYVEVHLAKIQYMDDRASANLRPIYPVTAITSLQQPEEWWLRAGCPSPKEFFKGYIQ